MKKVGNSFKGILGGFVFIIIGVILLWWNEGNNVRNLKTTAEISKIAINVSSDKVDSNNEGKLIATSGEVETSEVSDSTFNITVKSPLLVRVVETYQWEEESDTDEDGYTTYTYKKVWSEGLIDSSNFNQSGHDNPTTSTYSSESFPSNNVKVGAFSLTSEQISTLNTDKTYSDLNSDKANELGLKIEGTYYTNTENINSPQIGDYRISFKYNDSTHLSVLAVQTGSSFTSYVSSSGKTVNRVMDGVKTAEEMINIIKQENNFLKWILRLAGTLLCVIGFATILKPISTISSFVPILGSLVSSAVGLVALCLGLVLSFVIIAIAWIRFRPILGICLLVAAGALIFFLISKSKKAKSENSQVEPQQNYPQDNQQNL